MNDGSIDMKKLIFLAIVASSLVPSLAQAGTTRGELARDRHDIRDERRDLNKAYRHGDRSDVRDAREDLREAKQEYREDWRDYRKTHSHIYRRGSWHAPFRYERVVIGRRLPPAFYGRPYIIANPGYYRLPPAYGTQRWVRHYDDVLLIDIRTGIVRSVIRDFYW